MKQATVAASMVQGLMAFAVARGGGREALARRAGIAAVDLEDRNRRLPFARYLDLMRAARELCADPAFALHFGEAVDAAELSIVALIGQASETMADAFAQMNRYHRLVVDGEGFAGASRFELKPGPQGHWFLDRRLNPNESPEVTESGFARMACAMRHFCARPLLRAVHVTHAAPSHRAEYARIFQVPVQFESEFNALLLDPAWAVQRIAGVPRYVSGILAEHADALLQELENRPSMRGRLEAAIVPILHTGDLHMDRLARILGLSRQTLYRRLKAEGVSYELTLDRLRHKLALHHLAGQKASVKETSYLLGFSDPAAFSRAFRRWTGTRPSAAKV